MFCCLQKESSALKFLYLIYLIIKIFFPEVLCTEQIFDLDPGTLGHFGVQNLLLFPLVVLHGPENVAGLGEEDLVDDEEGPEVVDVGFVPDDLRLLSPVGEVNI